MSKRHRLRHWKVSHHACEMWQERVDPTVTTWQARTHIQRAMELALRIPNRLAGGRWVRKWEPKADKKFRQRGTRYYFHPRCVFVIGSKTHVVTVLPVNEADLAVVLCWAITGHWVNEDEKVI